MTAPRAADLPVGSIVATDTQAWIKYDDAHWMGTGDDMPTFNWEPQEALDGDTAQVLRVGDGTGQS